MRTFARTGEGSIVSTVRERCNIRRCRGVIKFYSVSCNEAESCNLRLVEWELT